MPSASALKFGIILCLSIGRARDFMSLMLGDDFPSSSALAFAPKTRYWDALGPAPHSIHFLANDEDLLLGRVELTRSTANSTTLYAIGTFGIKD